MASRFNSSELSSAVSAARSAAQQTTQVSTTTLLNALHTVYASGQTYQLDASTSLAVITWLTAENPDAHGRIGGAVDAQIASKAWEHARRRAEDACIVLASLHPSTPSIFLPFLRAVPLETPSIVFTALSALRPFLTCLTPLNASFPRHSSLAATYTTTLPGKVMSISFALSTSGIDNENGLLHVPSQQGYRAFDVFYYLLTSASTPAEREFLGLRQASTYTLLKRSGTYEAPSYLPAADDTAAAEDFRLSLKAIGIKGTNYRGLLSALAGLLKLGETIGFLVDSDALEEACEDFGGLVGLEPDVLVRNCTTGDREVFIAAMYEALVDWVICRANEAIATELQSGRSTPDSLGANEDTVNLTVIEIPSERLGKAVALRSVFDDSLGINAEMKEDGVDIVPAGHSVMKETTAAVSEVEADLGIHGGPQSREQEHERDRRERILERIGTEADDGGFLRTLLYPAKGEGLNFGRKGRFDLSSLLGSSRVWMQLCLHPTDEPPSVLAALPSTTSAWSAGAVSRQLRAWRLPEWANRRNKHIDFTADFDVEEFVIRYSRLGCQDGRDGVENFLLQRGWTNGEVVLGRERIWMREAAWWEAESMLDLKASNSGSGRDFGQRMGSPNPFETDYSGTPSHNGSDFFPPTGGDRHETLMDRQSVLTPAPTNGVRSAVPSTMNLVRTPGGDYGLGPKGDDHRTEDGIFYEEGIGRFTGELDPEFGDPKRVESKKISAGRIAWVSLVWALTWFIPSTVLRAVGRMKRPDVRMAWREKLVLTMFIFLLNACVVFYIIEFGKLLCPNFDKAWNAEEVGYHQGETDFYVSIHGKVYDISKFWKLQHSDTNIQTNAENMLPFAGQNLDVYFEPPLSRACKGLGVLDTIQLQHNNTDAVLYPNALHTSGPVFQTDPNTVLHSWNWYWDIFLPKITEYYKGDLVVSKKNISAQAQDDQRYWVIINGGIYDLTDYFYTLNLEDDFPTYKFFPDEVVELFQNNPGQDITDLWGTTEQFENSMKCLENAFYQGKPDFRDAPRCQVNNYILLAFTIVLCAVILVKFLAALQLGSKRRPAPQDKFVICLVPAYTEGEDQLRKSLDSLTGLQYDNKRKLICVVCDGMITGRGNERPTPKIVLDILGVDPKTDPPALPFRSVGTGSEQLNYGKVYSGLYEYEGNVIPYVVVVKVGKESEQKSPKPGNRGKRDSQILLMQFLNRVHFRAPMSPLELEMFHQINNIIGVDPELYEYLFMLDADTMVREDSLNRLVAGCVNNVKIAGICGETSLENEEGSWWTMIQVYEYYISHHLAKAFESLFGSVTCLPGCFCMYRLRTADKGRPLIISNEVIREYAEGDVDTLHKKNLLSLGEDRYLTTLMSKHFPSMSYKFIPDAYALTAVPETWSVLLSQRRRWINSTLHNLAELLLLKDLCGFCCFSMRFVVFIDLMGTLILPATCVYFGYLIYKVSSHSGQFPLVSLIMIACVYGLQALIFIIKRQWQHLGWMIIYIIAFPVYSFVLPIYSFWNQDNFSWGNTRIVLGEKGNKKVVAVQDDKFDPRSIPLQRWDDYARIMNLPGQRGDPEKLGRENVFAEDYTDDPPLELDDLRSTYSSVKPASTILTGLPMQAQPMGLFMAPPMSPSPFRDSMMPSARANTFRDQPTSLHGRQMSMMSMASLGMAPSYYQENSRSPYQSSIGLPYSTARQSLLGPGSRPTSTIDFRTTNTPGPSYEAIVHTIRRVLAEVDLDSVTKKQVRALVEQRLQCEITGEKRMFLDRSIDEELANM